MKILYLEIMQMVTCQYSFIFLFFFLSFRWKCFNLRFFLWSFPWDKLIGRVCSNFRPNDYVNCLLKWNLWRTFTLIYCIIWLHHQYFFPFFYSLFASLFSLLLFGFRSKFIIIFIQFIRSVCEKRKLSYSILLLLLFIHDI